MLSAADETDRCIAIENSRVARFLSISFKEQLIIQNLSFKQKYVIQIQAKQNKKK